MPFDLVISQKDGPTQRQRYDQSEITIGRVDGNDLVLASPQVSKRHSRIVLKDGKFIVVDLQSANGTYINGRRIVSPQILRPADKIYIGDFSLMLEPGADAAEPQRRYTEAPLAIAIAIDIERAGRLVERRQYSGFSVVNIGRGADNNIVLDDSAVAAHHAVLQTSAEGLVVIDRSNGRGLWVDGEPVAGARDLYPGAGIAIGPFVLKLR